LTGQPSADAIHDDIHTLAFSDAQNAVLEAVLREVDDMLISSRASAFGFLSIARGGDRQ
jgi:hypothetical protein